MTPLTHAGSAFKDEALDRLAQSFNVAQFVSFAPGPEPIPRFARLLSHASGFTSSHDAVSTLLAVSPAGTVNVRTFQPARWKGNPFHYGLETTDDVVALVRRYASQGFHVIVNETIPVDDGGVSGVRGGSVTEFAPGGTPRIVEEPGVCALDDATADALINSVYGVRLPFEVDLSVRIEFSVHLEPVGVRRERCLVWEIDGWSGAALKANVRWPNRFSRHVGDKAFGLALAHVVGLPVPHALVIARAIPPFHVGRSTGSGSLWTRTCPAEFSPGTFPTVRGWSDPFRLLTESDPDGNKIASVLVQDAVAAQWSGAARSAPGGPVVEGVAGHGDDFMLGLQAPIELPDNVQRHVAELVDRAEARFGPVRVEWVGDSSAVWLVQLNQQREPGAVTIVAGTAPHWLSYDPADGLDRLHELVEQARRVGAGIELVRPVGLTSHVGDVLRASSVPARFQGQSGV